MLLDGYDHLIDVTDNDGFEIEQVAKSRGHHELARFLHGIREFEVTKEYKIGSVWIEVLITYRKIVKSYCTQFVMMTLKRLRKS